MPSIDYKNIDHDLLVENGDFVKHDAQIDHIESIMLLNYGGLRQYPLLAVGFINYVNAPWNLTMITSLERVIRLQLISDGYTILNVNASDLEDIQINAYK